MGIVAQQPQECPWTEQQPGLAGTASTAHPEVLGVHVQLVAVQLRQLGVGALEVVQVLDGLPEGGQHLLAMGTHLGVADDGRGAGQVPEVREEPLGPGVDDQQPGERHGQVKPPASGLPCSAGAGAGVTPGVIPCRAGAGLELHLPGQGLSAALGDVDLAPEAGDELLLLSCPVHHGVGRGVARASLNNAEDVAAEAAPGIFIHGSA
uniref:Uncharacterized protein n=1 Tax=Geospiza parvula TaxID=87175 RepID=A0A8C3Q3N6_GEOPR